MHDGLHWVNSRRRAVGVMFLVALLWSSAGVLMKLVDWHGMALAGGRSFFAALTFLVFLPSAFRNTGSIIQSSGGYERRRFFAGAVAYFGTVSLFVLANKLTTAANAVLLQFTAPIYVALFSHWFLGERVTRRDWFAVIAVFLGITLFFADDISLQGGLGIICGIVSGVCFATMVLLLRRSASPAACVVVGNCLTAIVGLPFIFFEQMHISSIIAVFVLGVFQLGFGYVLYTQAIRYVTALEAILIPMLEPVLNPIWVAIVDGERPGPWALTGGVVVLIVVTLRALSGLREKRHA